MPLRLQHSGLLSCSGLPTHLAWLPGPALKSPPAATGRAQGGAVGLFINPGQFSWPRSLSAPAPLRGDDGFPFHRGESCSGGESGSLVRTQPGAGSGLPNPRVKEGLLFEIYTVTCRA